MNLDFKSYQTIKTLIEEDLQRLKQDDWCQFSYNIYVSHKLHSMEDFWKVVAFAYSWMPTIPTIHFNKIAGLEDQVFNELKKLQQGQGDVNWLFKTLSPVINNSVVGASKTLHFIAPDAIPIYDSRVIAAWTKLFGDNKSLTLKRRPNGKMGKVLFYTKKMTEWLEACRLEDDTVSLRDLELVLYYYGKKN